MDPIPLPQIRHWETSGKRYQSAYLISHDATYDLADVPQLEAFSEMCKLLLLSQCLWRQFRTVWLIEICCLVGLYESFNAHLIRCTRFCNLTEIYGISFALFGSYKFGIQSSFTKDSMNQLYSILQLRQCLSEQFRNIWLIKIWCPVVFYNRLNDYLRCTTGFYN